MKKIKMGFRVTYRGRDVFRCPAPSSGIQYGNPEFEWVLASQWAHRTYEDFRALHGEKQSEIVAAYRTKQRLDAVVTYANRPKK